MSERRHSREDEDILRIVCGALLLRHLFIEGRAVKEPSRGRKQRLEIGKKIKQLQKLEAEDQACLEPLLNRKLNTRLESHNIYIGKTKDQEDPIKFGCQLRKT